MRSSLLAAIALLASEVLPAQVDFARDIRPILFKNCVPCHGPDAEVRQANLRLDVREGAVADRGGYQALVPGSPESSRVFQRIAHAVEIAKMPPPATGKALSDEEISLIREWIEQGANYDEHWSFTPPIRHSLPMVRNASWPKNPIDHFVLARIEKEGLSPSPEADPHTLVRRLYLDLIGLPPSPAQVVAFVQDKKPGAYERVVDELLNSPRLGERWARVWLDLARYADSQGYESDSLRSIWPYRDWVIRALNDNMPYGRFTLEQLAGDLLPVPTRPQLVATGFHRNTPTNSEGGTDDEEFRVLAVKDRVSTTMQVWMGLTAGCAQCHDHKYDPITQGEFYQLYAFFNQSADSDQRDDRPSLDVGNATTLIMRELHEEDRRTTHVHERGNFLEKGQRVTPGVPSGFHPFPEGSERNRLGLAKWIIDEDNPLTSRVAVNRYWAQLFGAGLVPTEEDFGSQGALPTHPKLLDWMATEFMRLDWDLKAMLKLMVMSATYQQSSDVSPEQLQTDRLNRLLARGSRFRLEAEIVRDQALMLSGLLSDKMFGPPVMPWQPDGVWNSVYSNEQWKTSPGKDRYRRALYTLWRRSTPYPSLVTFDAPSRETCTVRRIPTNTPLQALVTLNDPVYMEAAEALAQRIQHEGGESVNDRAEYALRLCLARPPRPAEIARAVRLYEDASGHFASDPEAAQAFTAIKHRLYVHKSRIVTILRDARTADVAWRYSFEDPGDGWASGHPQGRGWKRGVGGFGLIADRDETNGDQRWKKKAPLLRSEWDTEDIWLHRSFEMSRKDLSGFKLHVNFWGSFRAYINGELAAEGHERSPGYMEIAISPGAEKALRDGENFLAVRCRSGSETAERQYIDVGLTAVQPPQTDTEPASAGERAAWATVAHVLLNLDEVLTRK